MKVLQGGASLEETSGISTLGQRQPSESEMLRSVSTSCCLAVSRMPRTLPLKLPPLLKSTCRLMSCAVESVRVICENDSTSPGHFSYTWVVYICEPAQAGSGGGVLYWLRAVLPVFLDCKGT